MNISAAQKDVVLKTEYVQLLLPPAPRGSFKYSLFPSVLESRTDEQRNPWLEAAIPGS